jgi:hypothetical protein
VRAARDAVAKQEKINPRILEIALQAAAICAAFDRRQQLRAEELSAAWEMARYQDRVRIVLAPNPGKNFEAQVVHKIMNYLNRHAPNGQLIRLRDLLNGIRAIDFGPSIVERTLAAMALSGTIVLSEQASRSPGRKARLIGLVIQ